MRPEEFAMRQYAPAARPVSPHRTVARPYHRLLCVAAMLALLVGLGLPPRTATAAEWGLTPGTYAYYTFEASAVTQVDFTMKLQVSPGLGNVFWANQFGLQVGDGGYVGMQTHRDGTGMWLVSIWGTQDAKPGSPGTYCLTFDEDGSGKSCRLDATPKVGHTYVVHARRGDGGWWTFSVDDTTAGTAFTLGSIQLDAADAMNPTMISWTEYFDWNDPRATCLDEPYSRLWMGTPLAQNGTDAATFTRTTVAERCAGMSKVRLTTDGAVQTNAVGNSVAAHLKVNDGRCLGGVSDRENVEVRVGDCANTYQHTWVHGADGRYHANWQCLDATSAGTVRLTTCDGDSTQVWWPRADRTLYNSFLEKCLVLRDDGVRLKLADCDGSDPARWFTVPHEP
jgi:hypothetical protein